VTQANAKKRFTILAVAADWHELMLLQSTTKSFMYSKHLDL